MSVDILDLITYTTFGDDRLRGLGVARDRISHFTIDLRRRHYNTRTIVWVCDVCCADAVVVPVCDFMWNVFYVFKYFYALQLSRFS